ncbi:hypothetical protein FRACYDRAFT_247382 [Fragilariopsis cylindrus CCMP1102]|uniref:Uncharacterized protein n=1 Tax=Fragilariopsis cylindrus CCMP1102 TaxID=635003 RepID=A0A1E7EWE2_9STRA|nr:hypothetical protein FRACYDRAFT_247382 [Fragilariopsis cylindrus CCMP1102]|eukprot:OEU10350.1 hypothetical protein FRACYDRAFT_247382 [Fragilariopsis cylindrus CCMP1102]
MGCIGKSRYVVVEIKDSMALETSSNDNMIWKKTNVSLAAVLAATLAASISTTVVVIDAFVVPRQAIPFTTTSTTTTSTRTELDAKKRVVVIGNGMVGQRFMEKFLEDTDPEDVQLSTFCDEPIRLELPSPFWYQFEIWLCTHYQCIFEN